MSNPTSQQVFDAVAEHMLLGAPIFDVGEFVEWKLGMSFDQLIGHASLIGGLQAAVSADDTHALIQVGTAHGLDANYDAD